MDHIKLIKILTDLEEHMSKFNIAAISETKQIIEDYFVYNIGTEKEALNKLLEIGTMQHKIYSIGVSLGTDSLEILRDHIKEKAIVARSMVKS